MNKVFLGGTCAKTDWREKLINMSRGNNLNFFNPVVSNWTPANKLVEDIMKEYKCNIHLYVLTSEMKGVYSVAEAVQSSHQRGIVTIVHVMPEGFDDAQLKSLDATLDLLKSNGAITLKSNNLRDTAKILTSF